MKFRGKKSVLAASLATVALAAAPIHVAFAEAGNSTPVEFDGSDAIFNSQALPQTEIAGEDDLALKVVPADVLGFTERVERALDGDRRFSAVEISEQRDEVRIWWHGEPSTELQDLLDESLSIPAQLNQTAHLPGELIDAAIDLVENHAGLGVDSATVRVDGSGLDVTIDQVDSSTRAISPDAVFEELTGFPVSVEMESYEPLSSRQFDTYRIGGAKVTYYDGAFLRQSCTTGFAIENKTNTSQRGIMFAAHCGNTGGQWVIDDGQNAYLYGTLATRDVANDGAIMTTSGSQNYMYTGPYTSSTFTPINGQALPPIGAEICYSGSYSGLVCGNIVEEKNVYYSLGGDLTNVRGIRTEQISGISAAGQGDSGGPGYMLISTENGLKRYAATIISAGPDRGEPCQGVQGRVCSSTILSTEVWRISDATGWRVPAVP